MTAHIQVPISFDIADPYLFHDFRAQFAVITRIGAILLDISLYVMFFYVFFFNKRIFT